MPRRNYPQRAPQRRKGSSVAARRQRAGKRRTVRVAVGLPAGVSSRSFSGRALLGALGVGVPRSSPARILEMLPANLFPAHPEWKWVEPRSFPTLKEDFSCPI